MKRSISLCLVTIIIIFSLAGCYRTEIDFENDTFGSDVYENDASDDETGNNNSGSNNDLSINDIIEEIDMTASRIEVQLGSNITVNARVTPYEKYSDGLGLYYAYFRGNFETAESELAANVNKLYGENIARTREEAIEEWLETGIFGHSNVQISEYRMLFDLSDPLLYYIQHDAYEYGGHWYNYIEEPDIYTKSIGDIEALFDGLLDFSTYTYVDVITIDEEFYERAERIYATVDGDHKYLIDKEKFDARTKFYMIKMMEEREGIPIDYILNFKSAIACNSIRYGLDENLELKAVEAVGNTYVETEPFETHEIVDIKEILLSVYGEIMGLVQPPIAHIIEVELSYVPQYMEDGKTVCIRPFWTVHTLEREKSSDIIYVYDAITGKLVMDTFEGCR
ncbi:MAG: hypothetical protein E7266_10010 [Lachnospiraceae bacterium]|nr:hypothetical protein [Lachnospiraceae bacterium]